MLDKKVAIIGGGIFGCMMAIKLAETGITPVVFERNQSIMRGASKNNQNRLHLGFHYPRDLNTAKQCSDGFYNFVKEFPDSIRTKCINSYYIAANNSRVTPEQYLTFCDNMGLSYKKIDLNNSFPIATKNIALGITCDEVIYDHNVLTELLLERFAAAKIEPKCNTEVISIEKLNNRFIVHTAEDSKVFDAVINCTYGNINRFTNDLGYPINKCQYEYTAIPIVQYDALNNIGLTIMDGAFLSFLPYGMTNNYLLYHVKHSVIDTIVDDFMPKEWLDENNNPFVNINKEEIFELMKNEMATFFPGLSNMKLIDFLHGPRMVMPNCDKTDARPSMVNDYKEGYMTVFSGKIDHCIGVANKVKQNIIEYFAM